MTTTKNTPEKIENRYLPTWKYNAARILSELEKIALNNGGALCTTWQYGDAPTWLTARKVYLIENRELSEAIREQEKTVERLERLKVSTAGAVDKLNTLKSYKKPPILSHYADYLYISFALENNYYYFSLADNPFFDFHYAKMKIENGKINQNFYLENDEKTWFFDSFFRVNCSMDDIKEAANIIFNNLLTAKYNKTYNTKARKPLTSIIYLDVK